MGLVSMAAGRTKPWPSEGLLEGSCRLSGPTKQMSAFDPKQTFKLPLLSASLVVPWPVCDRHLSADYNCSRLQM